MFNNLDVPAISAKIKSIKDKIGEPNPTSESWDTLFEALLKIFNKTVGHQTVTAWGKGDSFDEYSRYEDSYAVQETITFTFSQVPSVGWDYIKLNLGLQLKVYGNTTAYAKWEVGFGSSPSEWINLGEFSSTSANWEGFQEYFILSPAIFDNTTNIIQVRWSLKCSPGGETVNAYGKRYGWGTCEAFWR